MFDNLYENIGGKIKNWAKWIFIFEAIGAVIAGLVLLFTDEDLILYGFLTAICGPIVAYVSSWILYAFGELVEDMHAMRDKEGTAKEVNAKREAEMKAKYEAKKKAKREAEEQSKREMEENIDNFVPNPSKTVIPNKYEDSYSCPKCGCTLKFGQKECLCSWQMDWSKYN